MATQEEVFGTDVSVAEPTAQGPSGGGGQGLSKLIRAVGDVAGTFSKSKSDNSLSTLGEGIQRNTNQIYAAMRLGTLTRSQGDLQLKKIQSNAIRLAAGTPNGLSMVEKLMKLNETETSIDPVTGSQQLIEKRTGAVLATWKVIFK